MRMRNPSRGSSARDGRSGPSSQGGRELEFVRRTTLTAARCDRAITASPDLPPSHVRPRHRHLSILVPARITSLTSPKSAAEVAFCVRCAVSRSPLDPACNAAAAEVKEPRSRGDFAAFVLLTDARSRCRGGARRIGPILEGFGVS